MASDRRAMPGASASLFCFLFILFYLISLVLADCNPFDKRTLFHANKAVEYCNQCTIRSNRLNDGCELKLRCKPGYFFKDLDYFDGQKLKCKDGQWTDYKSGQLATIATCVAGCKALMENDINGMANATYIFGPPPQHYKKWEWETGYEELYYWEVGVRVETKCKPGYSFEDEHFRKRGTDNFKCNKPSNWYDLVINDGETGQRPGACKPNCDAIDNNEIPPGVEKIVGPDAADLIKISSGNKVYFGTVYKFRCKDGKPSADGRNEQMLICKGGLDGYYDASTAQVRSRVMSCSKNRCERITTRDLKIGTKLVTHKSDQCITNTDGQHSEGCKLSIKCEEGYYFTESEYSKGQKVVCSNGAWVEEEKTVVTFKVAVCQQGCHVLREDIPDEMGNATFIGAKKPTKTYKHDEFEYWASGTVVETKCKEGFSFDDDDNRKRGQDKHVCKNGEWVDAYQNKPLGTRPGLCPPLCNAIDERDLPTGVNITVNPKAYDDLLKVGDKGYVYSGAQYRFKCIDGYVYSEPINGKQEQTLICKGGELKYYDPATGKNQATINECVPSGCMVIQATNIDLNATIVKSNKICASPISPSTLPKDCELSIKCREETHYFENIDYSIEQKLICKGSVWVDQTGKVVVRNTMGKYSDTCKAGCKADMDMVNATYVEGPPKGPTLVHRNGESVIWSQGVVIATKCKQHFARVEKDDRHNEPNKYMCSAGNGWVNLRTNEAFQQPGQCEPMCHMPDLTPGTSYTQRLENSLVLKVENEKYIYSGILLRIKCDQGFELPPGVVYPNNEQQLLCKGGNLGFYDIAKGKPNSVPIVCVKSGAIGCGVIRASESTTEIIANGCQVKDGMHNKGCKIAIKCKKGYYPNVLTKLEKSQQTVECKAGNDGWLDVKTQEKNTVTISCQPVCPELKDMDRIDVVEKPNEIDTIKDNGVLYYRSKSIVKIKCKKGYLLDKTPELQKLTTDFECLGGPNKAWLNKITNKPVDSPNDICKKICNPIDSLPAGVIIVKLSQTYPEDGKQVVIEGDSYTLKCAEGYNYEPNSPSAKTGRQTLQCVGGQDGYEDTIIKKKNAEKAIFQCVRGPLTAGCSLFDINSPPVNVRIVESSGCNITNGRTPVGCKGKLECVEGFYIKTKEYSVSGYKEIECIDDGKSSKLPRYVDQFKKEQPNTGLECVPGCEMIDNLPNAVFIKRQPPTERSGSKSLYRQGSEAVVKCKEDAVLADGPPDSDKPIYYECKGGHQGWLNKNTSKNEATPGDRCVPVCPVPMRPGEGVRVVSKPDEILHKGRLVVREGGTYQFKCAPGYFYPKDTPYNKNNLQTLICDGIVKQYRDKDHQNTTTLSVQYCNSEVGPGCKDIPQENGYVESEKCPANVTSRENGCEMIVVCKDGYYPTDPVYQRTGKQELLCRRGKDWIDRNGKVINDKLVCLPGCVMTDKDRQVAKAVSNSGQSITVQNNIYYPQSTEIQVVCQELGVVWQINPNISRTPHTYLCKGGEQKWERKDDKESPTTPGNGCVRTCSVKDMRVPNSVQQFQAPTVFEYDGDEVILENSVYVFKCRPKYAYRPSSKHFIPNKQTLICKGDTRKLIDKEDPSNNYVVLEPCIRSDPNECQEIPQDPQSTLVEVKNCIKDGDYYPTGCQIEVSCKSGFYPAEDDYQKGKGFQKLTCQSGGRGWFDQFYHPINKSLSCIKGCIKRDSNTISYKDTKNVTANFIINGETIVCSTYELYKNQSVIGGLLSEHNYFCGVSDNKSVEHSYIDKSCTNACMQLEEKLPIGIKIYKAPVAQRIRAPNGKYYIANKGEYVFKCDTGFQYKPGTIHYTKKRQVLRCDGKTHQYDDIDTNGKNSTTGRSKSSDRRWEN